MTGPLSRSLALAGALSLLASAALAQPRPDSTRMSCAQAHGLVVRSGGLVLGTGGQTYDRYVRDRSFCEITEFIEPAFAPAADNPQCFVGYRCKEPSGRLFDD
jgi:hypothetical protein